MDLRVAKKRACFLARPKVTNNIQIILKFMSPLGAVDFSVMKRKGSKTRKSRLRTGVGGTRREVRSGTPLTDRETSRGP